MQKNGIVIGLEDKLALVDVLRPSECGDKCSNCSGSCNVKTMIVKVDNILNAKVGDNVTLELTSTEFVKSTFVLYTLPLMAFVIGLFAGYSVAIPDPNIGALLGGFGFIAIAYILINITTKNKVSNQGELLRMADIVRRDNVIV